MDGVPYTGPGARNCRTQRRRWPREGVKNAAKWIALTSILDTAISQARWLLFQKQRPLRDLEKFDNASRGVPGSFQLLFQWWKP